MRSLFVYIIVFFAITISSARGQDSPDALVNRASQLIDSTETMLNIRAQRFNEEMVKMNALKPLEIVSLAKETIPKSREKIKDFLSYLEVYRSLSAKMKKEIDDSVSNLRSKMSAHHRASFLKEFLDAYDLEQSALDKYTVGLTKFYTNINAVLEFIETSNVTLKDNKLQFTNKEEYEKYSELIEAVEKSNKKLINASATSQKATIDASAMMQKAYGAIRK